MIWRPWMYQPRILSNGDPGGGWGYSACPECKSWLQPGTSCPCATTAPCPADHTQYTVCPLCKGTNRVGLLS